MNVDIFVTCYKADLPWLRWLVRSAEQNLKGHRDLVIVYAGDADDLTAEDFERFSYHRLCIVPEREPGHMNQQVLKMSADKFVRPGCDWICLIDSDCFFHRPTSISTLFWNDGSTPVWYYGEWAERETWRAGSEEVYGDEIPYHMMRRQGSCVKPNHLWLIRRHIVDQHSTLTGMDSIEFDELILERWDAKGDWKYPERDGIQYHIDGKPTMCEFHVIGAYLWDRHFNEFAWARMEPDAGYPSPPEEDSFVRQFWSHSGVTPEVIAEMQGYLQSPEEN
jgi:hypothetical protein